MLKLNQLKIILLLLCIQDWAYKSDSLQKKQDGTMKLLIDHHHRSNLLLTFLCLWCFTFSITSGISMRYVWYNCKTSSAAKDIFQSVINWPRLPWLVTALPLFGSIFFWAMDAHHPFVKIEVRSLRKYPSRATTIASQRNSHGIALEEMFSFLRHKT